MAFGLTHQFLLLRWIPDTVALTDSLLAWPLYAVLAATVALLEAVAFAGMVTAHRRFKMPLPLAVAVPWVALEWARANMGGYSFPWAGLALGLAGFPEALVLAEWAGERGVAFWLACTGGLVALSLDRGGAPRTRLATLAGALLLAGAPVVLGAWRNAQLVTHDVARVAVVQPNVALALRRDRNQAVDTALARLSRLIPDVRARVDLLVAPEAVVPRPLDRDSALVRSLLEIADGVPMVLGAFSSDAHGRLYNAAWAIDERGLSPGPWEKVRLVPGWERTPGLGGGFLDPDGIMPGRGSGVLAAAGVDWGVLICFESLFGGLARMHVRRGAEAMLALTNDAWFNEGRTKGSSATHQHPAHLVIRAVETRKGIVRAANSGVSMVIAPTGAVEARLPVHAAGVSVATVRSVAGTTVYVRLGGWVGTGSAIMIGLALLRVLATRRRRRAAIRLKNGARTDLGTT